MPVGLADLFSLLLGMTELAHCFPTLTLAEEFRGSIKIHFLA